MATIISTADNAIGYLNTLYNASSTAPTSGEEDYIVWTSLFNIAINLWEMEDLWKELVVKLADAPDGTKTTTTGTYSYALPTLFSFPMSGFVWLGSGTSKTPYKVVKVQEKQLYENNSDRWCYFSNTTLEFNPNLTIPNAQTISYNYYKQATKIASGSTVFEMSDPMFAVYYALSELKKEEGDSSAAALATQKLNNMQDVNEMPAWYQQDSLLNQTDAGFGTGSGG